LILLFVVGGSCWLASIAVFANWAHAKLFALIASAVLLGWIAVQVTIIGVVSPLQPFIAMLAFVIGGLAQFLSPSENGGKTPLAH
jgi:hypothetical protein